MTQKEQILQMLEGGKVITQREAYEIGCTRLAARVDDLRREGHPVRTEMVEVTCRDGRKTHVARYSLPRQLALVF